MALFGMTVILGPVMGPLIGGWLTENLSWHYAFFVNVPVCGLLLLFLFVGLPHEEPNWEYLTEADWAGILGLILGLGALTVLLEEGHREEWFESSFIRWLTLIAVIGFSSLIYGQMNAPKPVLKLRLLLDRQFGSVAVMALAFEWSCMVSTYVIPQFLAIISDYNAFQTGLVIFLDGYSRLPAYACPPLHDPQNPHPHCRRGGYAADGDKLFRQHQPHRSIRWRCIYRRPTHSRGRHDPVNDVPEPGYCRLRGESRCRRCLGHFQCCPGSWWIFCFGGAGFVPGPDLAP